MPSDSIYTYSRFIKYRNPLIIYHLILSQFFILKYTLRLKRERTTYVMLSILEYQRYIPLAGKGMSPTRDYEDPLENIPSSRDPPPNL